MRYIIYIYIGIDQRLLYFGKLTCHFVKMIGEIWVIEDGKISYGYTFCEHDRVPRIKKLFRSSPGEQNKGDRDSP